MKKIPGQYKLWRQTNVSDIMSEIPYGGDLGELWSSFNIDTFEVDGKVRLGKKLLINTNWTDDNALTGVPVGFRINQTSGRVYTAAGASGTGYIFRNGGGTGNITSQFSKVTGVTIPGAPNDLDSLYTDIESNNGIIHFTKNSDSAYWMQAGEAAITSFSIFGSASSDAGYPKMLTTFLGRMYCTWGGNGIVSWDNTGASGAPTNFSGKTGVYSLNFGQTNNADPSTNQIVWMRAASNRIWIGTMNRLGGKAYIYTWDGSSNIQSAAYRLESSGTLACVIKNDVPYVLDIYGNLLMWSGGTFVKISQLNMVANRVLFNPLGITNNRFIHPNGMSVLYGQVSALIDGRNFDGSSGPPDTWTQLQTIPSGIYQYDKTLGLTHKHSITTIHANNTQTQDYGQAYLGSSATVGSVGGLSEILNSYITGGSDGSFLCGATYTIDASGALTPGSGIFSAIYYDNNNDDKQKAGWFITGKAYSENLTDIWQKFFLVYKPLLTATDKIVIKYRTVETARTPASGGPAVITATSTSTFTTTSNPGSVGDEVEIIAGINSGICAHITAIVNTAGTYTVTVDETLTSAPGQTSRAYFQAWKKAKVINDQTSSWKEGGFSSTSTSPWLQFKVWMLWTGPNEIDELIISSEKSQII